jgi:HEAT repeat protein
MIPRQPFHGQTKAAVLCALVLAVLSCGGGLVLALFGCGAARPPYEGKNVEELRAQLDSPDVAVQAQGALGLSRHGPEAVAAAPRLAELLRNSPDALVRQHAALALGKIGPAAAAEAVPALTAALADPEWTVRRHAILALGELGEAARPALPALEKRERDSDPLVRRAARETRARLAKAGAP